MKSICYDTETTGLFPHPPTNHEMFSYVVTDEEGESDTNRLDGSKLRQLQSQSKLKKLWADTSIHKTMHNAKFDLLMTEKRLGRKLEEHRGKVHCTYIMSHILQNHHPSNSLDDLGWELAEYPHIDGHIRKLAKQCGGYNKVPEAKMDEYMRFDGERGMLLYLFFKDKIDSNPAYKEIYENEMDLVWTTMRMEQRGMMIRRQATKDLISNLEREVDQTREELYSFVGERFNINSAPALIKILFRKYKLPILARTKKTKVPSTNKHVLMELQENYPHPVLDYILKLRSYIHGIPLIEKYLENATSDDILHPNINTNGAITSRESSENPNLQNVSKSKVLLNPFAIPARVCFGPRPGYINLHVDYSGVEMRLLIHYSRDPKMLKCMNDGDGDVHSLAAEVFYGNLWKDASKERREVYRSAAKNANFACPYGAGKHKVAQTLGLIGKKGFDAFDRYQAAFPTLVGLNKTVASWVEEDGYITTTFGRRLHVPQDFAYMGTNYLIQGTATAGLIKRAQNRVHHYNETQTSGEVHILLPIHDEIVIEYPRDRMNYLQDYLRDIRKLMIDFPIFDIPLEIEVEYSTWDWEHKLSLPIAA